MLRNETLCNWCIVLELRRKDTSSSHFEHMGCSKNSSLVIVGVSCYSLGNQDIWIGKLEIHDWTSQLSTFGSRSRSSHC